MNFSPNAHMNELLSQCTNSMNFYHVHFFQTPNPLLYDELSSSSSGEGTSDFSAAESESNPGGVPGDSVSESTATKAQRDKRHKRKVPIIHGQSNLKVARTFIELPGRQINDPSLGKHYFLSFLPATRHLRLGPLKGFLS